MPKMNQAQFRQRKALRLLASGWTASRVAAEVGLTDRRIRQLAIEKADVLQMFSEAIEAEVIRSLVSRQSESSAEGREDIDREFMRSLDFPIASDLP